MNLQDSSRMFCLALLLPLASAQTFPALFQFRANSVNGSSETGNCSNVNLNICLDPTSSVLFDGNIFTLTGLDGNMWATQLLTTSTEFSVSLTVSFAGTPDFVGVRRVEIVMFNCPEWGISVQSITLQTSIGLAGTINPNIFSCDSLVKVCIGNINTNSAQRELTLQFTPIPINTNDWVHIAEVTFYEAGPECPNNTILTTPTPPPSTTTPLPDTNTILSPDIKTSLPSATLAELTTHPETVCNTLCPTSTSTSCSTSNILSSVLTAISTALLATVIFVLVQIALCKYRPKATPGGAESAPSAGGEGLAEYEEMEVGGERGVAGSDPTYMEVGAGGEGSNTMKLKENAAYCAF